MPRGTTQLVTRGASNDWCQMCSKSHNVLGIAPVAIIDRQLPFEYTITSRSTDVVVMKHHVQNTNHSAFRSMFEREKLSGNNFNDWFRQLKLVLRVEKKMLVIEQPLPATLVADSAANVLVEWNAIYDAYNEEGKPVATYVIHMKGYVDQLERLGYVATIGSYMGELHAMLIEYEKAKGKGKANGKGKDKQDYIPKPKNPKPSAKEHPTKDDACHHCKEVGHWKRNCPVYLAELEKEASWFYQFFREGKEAKQGALYLYVGNGVCAQVEAIGSFDLVLPNGLVICLDNCHYVTSITRGVVSVHRLVENGFVQRFTDFGISISKNNVHYFNAIPSNGIYEIDMHNLVPNINSKYNVSIKRAKHNLDSTYLWHCRLAHINMCQNKVFKNEVENQLGKTIKALRSDRGGEYISQEFKDYLKACGIVQQLTPPYTPQHNGVSERRNRTLLDMVRSMMNLTTLPLSFWDYALESATRILNMVPTKKVDKTPYELWYGKVPNLSYLKVWGCEALVKRDTPDKLQQRSVKCIFIGYPKETMEVSGRAIDLEEIQDEDTSPSEITSKIPMEVEGFEPPQEEDILIRRSERTRRAPNHLSLNVEAEEHSLGDLNEPTSYKAAMLDSKSNKWIDAMNAP
ncbi:retrotransposon protein, putative, ty1-copia subclass [Tanacetum coccineum]